MSRPLRFFIAAITSAAITGLVPLLAFRVNLWAGGARSMFELMFRLSIPFVVIVAAFAAILPLSRLHQSAWTGIAGAAVGLLYWYLAPRLAVWRAFGQWPGFTGYLSWDFEIEAMICWSVAGACAMLLASSKADRRVLIPISVLCLAALLLPDPVFNYVAHNQNLTVAFVVPQTSGSAAAPRTIDINTTDVKSLSDRALELLRKVGVQGNYRVADLYRMGKGRPAWLVVVVNAPVSLRATLAEPNRTDVVYVQNGSEWKKVPASAPTLSRGIEIWPSDDKYDFLVSYMIPNAAGAGVGGSIRKEDVEPFTPPPLCDFPKP